MENLERLEIQNLFQESSGKLENFQNAGTNNLITKKPKDWTTEKTKSQQSRRRNKQNKLEVREVEQRGTVKHKDQWWQLEQLLYKNDNVRIYTHKANHREIKPHHRHQARGGTVTGQRHIVLMLMQIHYSLKTNKLCWLIGGVDVSYCVLSATGQTFGSELYD